jgi:hypothetical protein
MAWVGIAFACSNSSGESTRASVSGSPGTTGPVGFFGSGNVGAGRRGATVVASGRTETPI